MPPMLAEVGVGQDSRSRNVGNPRTVMSKPCCIKEEVGNLL
jgi:hypothetical protein